MAGEWYYTQDQEQNGPVPEDQLKELIASGQIKTSESVWQEGMAEWQTISSMPELNSAAGAPATPPPLKQGPPSSSQSPTRTASRRGGAAIAGMSLTDPATPRWKLLMLAAARQAVQLRRFGRTLMYFGVFLLVVALFVPWWSIRLVLEPSLPALPAEVKSALKDDNPLGGVFLRYIMDQDDMDADDYARVLDSYQNAKSSYQNAKRQYDKLKEQSGTGRAFTFGMSDADLKKREQELEALAPHIEQLEKDFEQYQKDREEYVEKLREMGKILRKRSIKDWYESHGVDEKLDDERVEADEDTKKISVWLWGWNVATGWLAFLFALLLIAPIAVVAMVVKPIRDWCWIGSFIVAILGLVVLIMSLMWVFGAPGKNVSPIFAQGNILGPYMTLLGSLAVLGSGITDAVFGLLAFIKRGT